MTTGDTVQVNGWAYAVSATDVRNEARMQLAGAVATVVRVVDSNAVVVRYVDGLQAPVHPSTLIKAAERLRSSDVEVRS